jgi:hypothetical protein
VRLIEILYVPPVTFSRDVISKDAYMLVYSRKVNEVHAQPDSSITPSPAVMQVVTALQESYRVNCEEFSARQVVIPVSLPPF